jgi:methionine-rich copper-binding protein CopC
MAPSRSTLARAALAAALLFFILPLTVAAHAELESASPADGSTVEGTPDQIVLVFSEAVDAGRSSLELRSAADAVVATGAPDPADPTRMVLEPPELDPGAYTIRWTSVAADGHVERGTVAFTVTTPPPTPTPTPTRTPTPAPSATPAPTASPTPTPAAASSPTPAPSAPPAEPTAGTGDVLIPILAGVVLLGGFGAFLLRRRSGGA